MHRLCEICGKPINPERLEVLPTTKRCVECSRTKGSDVVMPRPIEQYLDLDTYHDLLDAITD